MGPLSRVALRVSVAVYGLLLHRYPRRMRKRYGRDMRALFEDEAHRRMQRSGPGGLAALWWKAIRDLARPLPPEVERAGEGLSPPSRRSGPGRPLGGRLLAGLSEDLAFAARSLVREPRFGVLVVGVLAIGIALNTTAFTALNAYLLRPLPFPDADRLVTVRHGEAVSWTEVDDVFERAVSWDLDVFTIVGDGRPEMAPGAWVTPDFLETYGVRPRLGRSFRPEEAGRTGAPVAIISHRLWQERFGGDPEIVGRSFSAFTSDRPDHAERFTVVGVLPADFWYLNEYTEVLAPIRDPRAVYTGVLRRDVPVERGETILTEMARRTMDELPPDFRVELEPLKELHVASIRPTLLVLQAAVLLVLLIACANAAVLLLIRSARRERELGIRRALGASGARLARQLVLEGGLISVAATAVGLALTAWGLHLGRTSMEAGLGLSVPGGADRLVIDGTVVAGATALAAVVGLVFGAVPLVTSLRGALATRMSEGRRGSTESRGRRRFRSTMVAAEVALSLALLTGAGLMVRSALHLQSRDLGFDPTHVVRGTMGLREASYPEPADRVEAFSQLRDRLAAVPGVDRVGLASMGLFTTRFAPRRIEGLREDEISRAEAVRWVVDEGYFEALDIRMLGGRGVRPEDAIGAEGVAVVSETLARDLWDDADPVGLGVRVLPFQPPGMPAEEPGPWLRVVGVVSDVQREVGSEPVGDVYRSFRQAAPTWLNAVVRYRTEPSDDLTPLQAAVDEVDSEIPLASPRRLDRLVDEAMEPTRQLAGILVAFAGFALLLAIVGLYGVVSYAARQAQKDVAIRMALGADRGSVTSLFVRQGLVMVGIGLAVGTFGGIFLGQALEGRLHGVQAGDPATHGLLALVLAASALVAVWIPARRAARSDPMGVLRED